MRQRSDEVRSLLALGGVLSSRDRPDLAGSLEWLARAGEVVAVLPGVYAPTAVSDHLAIRLRAVRVWAPEAVLVGPAAAAVTFWPGLEVPVVAAALRSRRRRQPGFSFTRRTLPPELVGSVGGLRVTVPALTALDLCDSMGGAGIDAVLRTRSATLTGLTEALRLTADRPGNRVRRALLHDSRDEPWSEAERRAHRLLRGAGIGGWQANLAVTTPAGTYYLDVGFRAERVALEIDGRRHHSDPAAFERDRRRQNLLVLAGWRVLRFTWAMLVDEPEVVVATVRQALRHATPDK
ncbi:MAG: hypothetical protein JWP61_1260 [Friedmanniella sp.]|nr:hypothetical protein [Friedmanniella sp.]